MKPFPQFFIPRFTRKINCGKYSSLLINLALFSVFRGQTPGISRAIFLVSAFCILHFLSTSVPLLQPPSFLMILSSPTPLPRRLTSARCAPPAIASRYSPGRVSLLQILPALSTSACCPISSVRWPTGSLSNMLKVQSFLKLQPRLSSPWPVL